MTTVMVKVETGRFTGEYEVEPLSPLRRAEIIDATEERYRRKGANVKALQISAALAAAAVVDWRRDDGTEYSEQAVRRMVLEEPGGIEQITAIMRDADDLAREKQEELEKN